MLVMKINKIPETWWIIKKLFEVLVHLPAALSMTYLLVDVSTGSGNELFTSAVTRKSQWNRTVQKYFNIIIIIIIFVQDAISSTLCL